jgi:cytochrome P460
MFTRLKLSSIKKVFGNLGAGTIMKRLISLLIAISTAAGVIAFTIVGTGHAAQDAKSTFVTEIPPGYRDWRFISVAHEEGNLNSFAAILGNEIAIKAYRDGKLPFPDGAIIAALHWRFVPSEENNKVFGRAQSFVAGSATNVQFMVKDSKKYASTGGWGFGHFVDGKPADEALLKTCFPCHAAIKDRDLVFTRYSQ